MSKKVMVTLDGSEKDGRALSVGMAIASLLDSAVHLVRVIGPPSLRTSVQTGLVGVDASEPSEHQDAEKHLAKAAARLTARVERPISWELVAGIDVSSILVRLARSREIPIVVMGTRAALAAGLALAGSVADRVLRACPKPVVLVPPGATDLRGKDVTLERVLVPVDGSPLAARSVDFLLRLPRVANLQVVLCTVIHNARDIGAVERRLQRAADRFSARSAHAESRVVVAGDAAKTIATAAREFLVDMIAMSTRGESGLRRLVLGSVARGVVRASEVPVLLLTPTMLAARSGHSERKAFDKRKRRLASRRS